MTVPKISEIRKFLVALAGLVTQVIALGVLNGDALHWAQGILAALTAIGVYAIPNGVKDAVPVAAPAEN